MVVGWWAAPAEGTDDPLAAVAAEGPGIDPVTATATTAEAVASHRRADGPVVGGVISMLLR
jgi:hypothetical protein